MQPYWAGDRHDGACGLAEGTGQCVIASGLEASVMVPVGSLTAAGHEASAIVVAPWEWQVHAAGNNADSITVAPDIFCMYMSCRWVMRI